MPTTYIHIERISHVTKTKLRDLNPRANYTDCRLSAKDLYGSILGFLDRSRYFSSKYLLNCAHEAEWTPFQTYYFSEILVAPGIEPGPLDL
jgi:hypothetical protein